MRGEPQRAAVRADRVTRRDVLVRAEIARMLDAQLRIRMWDPGLAQVADRREDRIEQVLIQAACVTAVGQQRDSDALLRHDAQERVLPDRAAVVTDDAVLAPIAQNPTETPTGRGALTVLLQA